MVSLACSTITLMSPVLGKSVSLRRHVYVKPPLFTPIHSPTVMGANWHRQLKLIMIRGSSPRPFQRILMLCCLSQHWGWNAGPSWKKDEHKKNKKCEGFFFIIILICCFLLCFFKLDLRNNNDIVVLC